MRRRPRVIAVTALILAASALAGCGNSAPKTSAPPPFRGIFTTSSDCAASGKLTSEQCLDVMEKAVAEHEKAAPSYSSLKSCEATEGVNRCERTHAATFRPVLLAILVTASTPPAAIPLYAIGDKKVGFRSAKKEIFLADDDKIRMSEHAQTVAEANMDKKAKQKSAF